MPERTGTAYEPVTHMRDFEELLAVAPDLKFTLDIGHAIQNSDNFEPFVLQNPSTIVDIHLHDAFKSGSGHLGLGTADLDLDHFARILSKSAYRGFVSFETVGWPDTELSWKVYGNRRLSAG